MHRTIVRDILGPSGVTYASLLNLALVAFVLSLWFPFGFFPLALLLCLSKLLALDLLVTSPEDDIRLAAAFVTLGFTLIGGFAIAIASDESKDTRVKVWEGSIGGFVYSSSTPRPSSPSRASPTPATTLEAQAQVPADDAASARPGNLAAGAGEGGGGAGQGFTLEKEVQQVFGGLGSFWGKVRKQGATALQSAQAEYTKASNDLTPLLSRAQQQLDHLSAQTKAEIARLSEQSTVTGGVGGGQGVVIGPDGMPVILDDVPPPSQHKKDDKGKGVDRSATGESTTTTEDAIHDASSAAATEQTPAQAASAFFRQLSSSAAPQLQSLSRDLSSLQSNLSTNLHQLQSQLAHLDVGGELASTQKLAEGYLHKGEHWLAEFGAEVGKLAKDAVRVVPPTSSSTSFSGPERSLTPGSSALSRRELLLYKLRTDPSLLLVDPALPPSPSAPEGTKDVREAYAQFVAGLQSTMDGFDTPPFREKVALELEEGGEALSETLRGLTEGEGAQLGEEAFWGRYFFRKGEIEAEEDRRRKVLQVSADQSDDDFSWDMDDEESASSIASPPPTSAPSSAFPLPSSQPAVVAVTPSSPSRAAAAPAAGGGGEKEASPRASSETTTASYDVVGEKSGNPSDRSDDDEEQEEGAEEGDKTVGEVKPAAAGVVGEKAAKVVGEPVKKVEEDSDDSDWE
ncbi:hypothetical protein JCM8547_005762 [Rhodosporidiobolus lusitaniae]